jgi:hypothetical protein
VLTNHLPVQIPYLQGVSWSSSGSVAAAGVLSTPRIYADRSMRLPAQRRPKQRLPER